MPSINDYRNKYPSLKALDDSALIDRVAEVQGVSREDVMAHMGYKPKPRGILSAINDTVIEGANAVAGGVKSVGDFVAPGNPVSEFIDENIIKAGEDSQSDVVKAEKARYRAEMEGAQGIGDEVGATLGYVARNPVQSLAQAAGSFVLPGAAVKGGGMLASMAGAGAKGATRAGLAGGAVAGAALSGGDAAGTAYELVKKAGGTDEQAEEAARRASVLPAAIGAAGGVMGAEKLLAGGKGFAGGTAARALKTAGAEGLQEAVEEGVTQYEGQAAAVPYDPTIDPMKGVAGAATMGAVLGGATGGAVSLLEGGRREAPKADPVLSVLAAPSVDDAINAATAAVSAKPAQKTQAPAELPQMDADDRREVLGLLQVVNRPGVSPNVARFAQSRMDALLAPYRSIPTGEVTEMLPVPDARELTDAERAEYANAVPFSYRRMMAKGLPQPEVTELLPTGDATEVEPIPAADAFEELPAPEAYEVAPVGEASELLPTPDVAEFDQVPAGEASELDAETIQADDLLARDGEPFTSKTGAQAKAYASGGGKVVAIPDHFGSGIPGYVVRPLVQARPNNTRGTNAGDIARAGGQRDADGRGSDRTAGVPDTRPSDVLASPASPAGQGVDGAGAAGGAAGRADALSEAERQRLLKKWPGLKDKSDEGLQAQERWDAAQARLRALTGYRGSPDTDIQQQVLAEFGGDGALMRDKTGNTTKRFNAEWTRRMEAEADRLQAEADTLGTLANARRNREDGKRREETAQAMQKATQQDIEGNLARLREMERQGRITPADAVRLGELARSSTDAFDAAMKLEGFIADKSLPAGTLPVGRGGDAANAAPTLAAGDRITLSGASYTVVSATPSAVKLDDGAGNTRMVARNSKTFAAITKDDAQQAPAPRTEAPAPTSAPATEAPAAGTGRAAGVEADGVKPRKTLQEARADAALDKPVRENGEQMTRRQWVERKVAEGLKTKVTQEDRIKPMSRMAYFRANNEEQRAHDRKVKEAGKKDVFWIGDYEVTKTEHDYANALTAEKAPTPNAAAPASTQAPERRKDLERRKRVNEMTPDEMRAALLTDDLTGLNNGRWLRENQPNFSHIAAFDADSLKWVNDNMGHEAGDMLLKAWGAALQAATPNAARMGGDEFFALANSQAEAQRIASAVESALAQAVITASTPDGDVTIRGIGASFGIAQDRKAADEALNQHKRDREAAGTRAGRGEQPPGTTRKPAGGQQDQADQGGREDDPAGQEVAAAAPTAALTPTAQAVKDKLAATHKDPGEPAEPVTPAVVREAIKTGVQDTGRKPSAMKAELLEKIDAAMAEAKGDDDQDVRVYEERSRAKVDKKALDRRGLTGVMREKAEQEIQRRIQDDVNKAAERIGYTTFSVPGDGVFKVLNTKDRLAEFRRKVEQSPGFKDRQPAAASERVNGRGATFNANAGERFGVESGSGSKLAAFDNMVNEGDLEAASDYADAVGLELDPKKIANATKVLKWRETRPSEPAPAPQPEAEAPAPAAEPDALPNPWEISQDEFVRRATFTKEGSTAFPWVAKWGDRILEAENEVFDHPDLGKTVVQGGRFSKTKREAEAKARGAHKRAVRRGVLNGYTATPEALAAYPDLQPGSPAAPAPAKAPKAGAQRFDVPEPPTWDYRLKQRGGSTYMVPPVGQAFTQETRRALRDWATAAGFFATITGDNEVSIAEMTGGPSLDYVVDGVKEQAAGRQAAKERAAEAQKAEQAPAEQAAAILNAAAEPPKGAERLSVIKDVKAGAITPDEVAAAYPAKDGAAPAVENDRNTFTLQRVDEETGQMGPVTFRRGQRVKVAHSHPMRVGVIDGISHAERRVSVDGLWTDFGYVYPESYDEFKKHRESVSKQLANIAQRLDEDNAIEATNMLRAAQQKAENYKIAGEFKAEIERLQQQTAKVEAANAERFKSKRDAASQRRNDEPPPPPRAPIKMTMEEWKAVPKDYKGTFDGVRSVMREGGMVAVEIVKPAATTGPRSIIDGPDAQFSRTSRAPGATTGVPMEDARALTAAIREALPTAPPIQIHDSVRKAPETLRALIRKAGAENDVEAVYHEGEIHVFPGNISSIERMQFVVAHHEVRHHGLRAILGPQMGPAMLRMYASNANLKAAANAKMAAGLADTRILAVEEALADMPVEDLQKLTGWGRIVAAARQWLRNVAAKLRRAGLNTLADAMDPEGWTDNDIAALVQRAENVSRGGAAPYSVGGTVFQRQPGVRAALNEALAAREAFNSYDRKAVRVEDADQFFALSAKATEARDALAAKLLAQPDDGFALQGRTSRGRMVIVNGSAQNPGQWQLTRFDGNDEPWGDSQYRTKESALTDFLREIDLTTLQDMDGAFSRADQTQTPARPEAARAVDTGKRSPLTGKPLIDLLDAAGNRIETSHIAATADEALENYRQRPARQAAARAAAPAPTYAMPERDAKAEGSNWRRVRGQEFTSLDEDDGYLYHVTSAPAAGGVREQGLVPNAGGMFGGFYANYSAGKVFLTERSGVSYWQEKVGQQLEQAMDNPPAVVVLRIPKEKIKAALQPDTVGSGDAGAPAYYSTQAVFSRSPGAAKVTAQRQVTQAVRETVADYLGSAGAKVSWWDKTLGTQYAKAQKFPAYKRVFDQVQQYLEDTSAMANEAADQAKGILPKLETWKDLKNFGLKPADAKAIAAPIFTGTLTDQKVYSDGELRARFNLTPEQIGQYRQFRATVDTSLDQAMAAEAIRMLGDKNAGLRELALTDRAALRDGIAEFLTQQAIDAGEDVDAEGEGRGEFTLLRDDIAEKYQRIDDLKAQGYAPLMRFGQFKVNITDRETGETLFFGLYESKAAANAALRDMQGDPELKGADFEQGVLSQEQYKLFSAMPLDSLEMFAEAIGADQSDVFQDFIRLAKSNRSAMKRLLKRKGTAGFSEDVPRVLAAFVTSNARMASGALNMPSAKEAAQNIRDGDVQDEAIKLLDVVQNPTDTAGAIRGLMFVNFLGGSIASAVVNLTQPLTMTLPYLSQFGGGVKAAARLMAAGKMVASGKVDDMALRVALKRAETDGIVSPQEIHHLQAQAMGTFGTHPLLQRAAFVWGAPFSLAEQFNRRVSFIAAFQTAKEQGIDDPFGFAEQAVTETQGLYNKGNAPNLARGAVGAAALTFRQFSIHYLEWMGRMWKSGPQGKKAVGLALALLILAAGTDGLPFADDLDDLVDTLGQALGYDMNVKRARRQFVAKQLGMGDAAADVMARGFSAVPGVPLDVSLRMSMGNLVPGTGMFLRSNTDKSRDLLEIAGPAGGLAKQYIEAGTKALRGDIGGAAQSALPVAFQNAFKATEMWSTGEARDTLGRKVMDADAVDGLMKFIGFQPQAIARESEKIQMIRNSEQLAKNVEGEIAGAWARAIVDKDADGVAEARAKLARWNEDNPESPIRIKMQQIITRAKKLREDRASRFITSVSPERRRAVAEALE